MKTYVLGEDLKLILKNDTLALISKTEMTTVSSAVYNGGFRKARSILNVHVPENYDQKLIHENPEQIIIDALKDFDVSPQQSVSMITAADVKNFSISTAEKEDLKVNVIVTAGCSFAETAGENIEAKVVTPGTINIIVAIHGNPTESCLMQTFITAVEAKTAGLRDLDVRSKYSGDPATGTITDSLIIASTNIGPRIRFGGPASKLGKLVGSCTREAVKNAVMKQSYLSPNRSILKRFAERKLPIKDFVSEISKANSLEISEEEVWSKITEAIEKKPSLALILMMAAKIDEDAEKGLIPKEFGNITYLSEEFKETLLKVVCEGKHGHHFIAAEKIDFSLSPFLKKALVYIIEGLFSRSA